MNWEECGTKQLYLLWGTEENQKNLNEDGESVDQDLNLGQPCCPLDCNILCHSMLLLVSGYSNVSSVSRVCVWVSDSKASHSHRTWTEVSSSVPHFLQVGPLLNPITYRCLLRVLGLVRRPVTTLDCVLLKYSYRVFVAGLGTEINFWACLSITRTMPHCQMLVIHPAFNLIIDIPPRDPNGRHRSNKFLSGATHCEFVGDFISTYPSMSRDPVQPYSVPVINIIRHLLTLLYQWWHCFGSLKWFQSCLAIRLNTNILLWSPLSLNFITQANIAYTSAWKTVACFPTGILSLLPKDCP